MTSEAGLRPPSTSGDNPRLASHGNSVGWPREARGCRCLERRSVLEDLPQSRRFWPLKASSLSNAGCRRPGRSALLIVALFLASCAPVLAPVPVVTSPRYPDFLFPAAPASLAGSEVSLRQQRGWQFLQAGDVRGARREFNAALKTNPEFYPADAGLAYASLADRDYADAAARFDRVLKRSNHYVPALVGKGDSLAGAARLDEAVMSYREALAADPGLADVARRLEVLAFRSQQAALTAARQAAEAGRYDEAAAVYGRAIAASPDSGLLYRELAAVERQRGEADKALEHLRKAVALDPTDSKSLLLIGEVLEERGDFAGAVDVYSRAAGIEPGDETRAHLARARGRVDLAKLPEEYNAIGNSPQVTRGELAALVGTRLGALLQAAPRQDAVVITDVRSHWAAPWIMATVRAGVMEVYPNHSFGPRGVVRRLELAQVAGRILGLIELRRPVLGRQWRAARPRITDLPTSHLGYPAAAMAVGADVMPLVDGALFKPTRVVAGSEALDVVQRLEVLAR
jgi:tetratricopeptide (TPR) repeat protein